MKIPDNTGFITTPYFNRSTKISSEVTKFLQVTVK